MTSFSLNTSHSQVAVCRPGLEEPFNDWSPAHVDQGFAWRPGAVSFRTLHDSGPLLVEVLVGEYVEHGDASRIIVVPFQLPREAESVEIASIMDSKLTELAAGQYDLVFEHGVTPEPWCRLVFTPSHEAGSPRIIKADSGILRTSDLVMEASPA